MKLSGTVYDFGDQKASEHLRSISDELDEQAFLNGEDDADISRGHRPLYDLSELLERLADEVQRLERLGGR